MRAYIIKSQKQIEPFNEHPGACLIVNNRLSEHQEETLGSLGLSAETVHDVDQIRDPDEHLIIDDSLYFTPELLESFVARSRRSSSSTVCALRPGVTTRATMVATQDVRIHSDRIEYGLRYLPQEQLRGEIRPVIIDPDESIETFPCPRHVLGDEGLKIPMTDKLIIQIDHWTNIWAANVILLFAETARLQKRKMKLLGCIIRAFSLNQWKILHKANKIGKKCDIHPTAYVEGSTIGNNVTIGANAVVRESVIGDDVHIGSSLAIEFSIVGSECYISSGSSIVGSVLYPESLIVNNLTTMSLLGRGLLVATGVFFTDTRFDNRDGIVIKDGKLIDTGNKFIGCCVGHGVYLGAGSITAPGRTIPNGLRIVPEEGRVINKCNIGEPISGYRLVSAPE